MDQGSNDIRQTIEDTRESLTEKLDALESKARQTFDLKHQVAERPWLALGAAVATGYVLGSLGGGESEGDWSSRSASGYSAPSSYGERGVPAYKPHGDSFLSQFDDEIDMLKTAAMATLTNFLRDSIKEYAPALGRQLDQTMRDRGNSTSGQSMRGKSVSTAPGASSAELSGSSKYYDVRESSTTVNHEAIPETTYQQSNMADRDAEHATPYYPPGSSGNRERSVGDTKNY